jgi:hypothetical protein
LFDPASRTPENVRQSREEVSMGGTFAARVLLTVLGAAAMIIGAFLRWASFEGSEGVEAPIGVFWTPNVGRDANIVTSAGGVFILLGLLALVGLAFRTGALTRLAGALGIVGFVLVVITIYRIEGADLGIGDVRLGLWLILAGGILALIGGFLGTRTVVHQPATAPPPPAA